MDIVILIGNRICMKIRVKIKIINGQGGKIGIGSGMKIGFQ